MSLFVGDKRSCVGASAATYHLSPVIKTNISREAQKDNGHVRALCKNIGQGNKGKRWATREIHKSVLSFIYMRVHCNLVDLERISEDFSQ